MMENTSIQIPGEGYNTGHVKPGDVFYNSWGYEQTNVDFYRVVSVTKSGKSARVIPIGKKTNKVMTDMSETVIPDLEAKSEGQEKTFRISKSTGSDRIYLGPLSKWDGRSLYQSHYA